jgi:hypothetical protein
VLATLLKANITPATIQQLVGVTGSSEWLGEELWVVAPEMELEDGTRRLPIAECGKVNSVTKDNISKNLSVVCHRFSGM